MAIEGNTSIDIYFSAFNTIIDNFDFIFTGRNRKPSRDKVNALISFGNTLL